MWVHSHYHVPKSESQGITRPPSISQACVRTQDPCLNEVMLTPKPGAPGMEPETPQSVFLQTLSAAATKGVLHDCLQFNNGLSMGSVLSWKMMEYLPFRRMDLRPDGSWKAISMPLPRGEVRDIPENAWIHHSAIRRMEANEGYR